MVEQLTFKQYLKSKETLYESIKKTPKQTKEYNVTRYCNFIIGENKDDRKTINLKPHMLLTIDWLYENMDDPTPLQVRFDGIKDVSPTDDLIPAWTNRKIQKWLIRNTTEESIT
jgi:hypothetical protein